MNRAGGITHDFNNLLGVIMNYADFVLEALDAPAPEEVKDIFERARADTETIFQAAEAAAVLARQLDTGSPAPTGGGRSGPEPAGTGQRIMVVDDEDAIREIVRRILAGRGYSVRTVADAWEALWIVEDTDVAIDLVLTDVVMPGLSGPELVERLRRIRPGLRSIYMSGQPEAHVERHHPDGDVTVVRKPFTPGLLIREVRMALGD